MDKILFMLLAFLPSQEVNWPSYRGPYGNGHSDAKNLPVEWNEQKNIKWKIAISGKAWASPVVWGNQVWLSNATEKGDKLSVIALDISTGKIIHDLLLFEILKPMFNLPTNSYASPTPAIEEGRVYIHFGSAGTACLDTKTGKTIWARQDIPCDHWRGPASSPIIFENLLILTFDGYDAQYITALDKLTGKTVWRKDRTITYGTNNGDNKKAFSTPAIFKIDGKNQMISPAAVGTVSYDPSTGEELWKVHHGGMNAACRPLLVDGKIVISTGDGGWKLFAVKPDGKGDVTSTHVAWKTIKGVPSRSTPIQVGNQLFMVNEAGTLSELDTKSGEVVRQERLGGVFYSSPLFADGKLFLFNEQGSGFVVKPEKDWKILQTNKLDSGCMASPAAVGMGIILRTKTHLYLLENIVP